MWTGRWMAAVMISAAAVGCSYPEKAPDWGNGEGQGGVEESSLVSIEYLKSHYKGYPYTFKQSFRIRGCVVSSDLSGNYYKALAVKDETGAIEIKIDCGRLFERYPMGSIVEVPCNGLTIGSYGGMLQLGTSPLPNYETGYISEDELAATVRIAGVSPEAVEPEVRRIDGLVNGDVGRFVAFADVQFATAGDGVTWCDPDEEDASGFRNTDRELIDRDGNTISVRTSCYAGFASWTIPVGSGLAEGILTVYNGKYQLRVIRPDLLYVSMSGERF